MEAFGQELSRKKPIFVIYILINAANIDVNLDPNKNFVLFKEQVIVFVKFCIILKNVIFIIYYYIFYIMFIVYI